MVDFLNLPSRDRLVEITEQIATRAESAKYVHVELSQIFKKAGAEQEFKGLLEKFGEHAKNLEEQEKEPPHIWAGILPSAVKMQMEVEVDEKSKISRGYLQDNAAPDDINAAEMDKMFNEWLTNEGWTCKEGMICEAIGPAEPRLDKNGELIPVDLDRLEEKL